MDLDKKPSHATVPLKLVYRYLLEHTHIDSNISLYKNCFSCFISEMAYIFIELGIELCFSCIFYLVQCEEQFEESTRTVKLTQEQFTNLYYKKLNVDEI
jgi:hypothetical protein